MTNDTLFPLSRASVRPAVLPDAFDQKNQIWDFWEKNRNYQKFQNIRYRDKKPEKKYFYLVEK